MFNECHIHLCLYLLKCVLTYSIFVDSNTKIFLSVLGVFGKYFVFTKTEKFQKTVLPYFGDSVAGHPSRMLQPRAHVLILATCSRGVHRDFRGSARDSLAGRPSSREKHLENFFTIFPLSVLAACPGVLLATCLSRDNACSTFRRQFLKLFQFFPRIFVTIHCLPHFSLN